MKRLSLCLALLGCLALAPVSAQTPPPSGQETRQYLFLVDTSFAMNRVAQPARQVVFDLLWSGLQGRMRPGDEYSVWTFNDRVYPDRYPPMVWDPTFNRALAVGATRFLKNQHCEKSARLDRAIASLPKETTNATALTVFLISDGKERIQGTPFDRQINEVYLQRATELHAAKQPLITTLVMQQGRIAAWKVQAAGEPLVIPEVPPVLARPAAFRILNVESTTDATAPTNTAVASLPVAPPVAPTPATPVTVTPTPVTPAQITKPATNLVAAKSVEPKATESKAIEPKAEPKPPASKPVEAKAPEAKPVETMAVAPKAVETPPAVTAAVATPVKPPPSETKPPVTPTPTEVKPPAAAASTKPTVAVATPPPVAPPPPPPTLAPLPTPAATAPAAPTATTPSVSAKLEAPTAPTVSVTPKPPPPSTPVVPSVPATVTTSPKPTPVTPIKMANPPTEPTPASPAQAASASAKPPKVASTDRAATANAVTPPTAPPAATKKVVTAKPVSQPSVKAAPPSTKTPPGSASTALVTPPKPGVGPWTMLAVGALLFAFALATAYFYFQSHRAEKPPQSLISQSFDRKEE